MRSLTCFFLIALTLLAFALPLHPQAVLSDTFKLETLDKAQITVLVDNSSNGTNCLGEWGAAFLIETGQQQILFDTGGGRTLLENAAALQVDLSKTEAIIISHGHGDHTEGLEKALQACGKVELYVHPAAFATRYWQLGTQKGSFEFPFTPQKLEASIKKLYETTKPVKLGQTILITGEIPRISEFEDTGIGGMVFMDQEMKIQDQVRDDQALIFRVPEGMVVVLGCAHAGVINTLEYINLLTGGGKIYAVIGGSHLISASPERMQKTIAYFQQHDIAKIMLGHCTGIKAFSELSCALPGRCSWPGAGTRIKFGGW